jgi:hypothetical protein
MIERCSQANCRRPEEISGISLKIPISLQVWKEMHEYGSVRFGDSFPFYDMGTESYRFVRSRIRRHCVQKLKA